MRGEALTGGIGELGVFGLLGVMVPEAAWPEARGIVSDLHLGEAALQGDEDDLPGAQPA